MARPRISAAQAELTGAAAVNPGRFRDRGKQITDDRPLGKAPAWLKPDERRAWGEFRRTMPWLRFSHRSFVALTATLLARVRTGAAGIQAMNLLRQCLAQMGATPATGHFAAMPEPEPDDDLLD